MLLPAKSLTHEHVLSVIMTEAARFAEGTSVRILDAGCGDGSLIRYLHNNLHHLSPGRTWEVFGFDVADHGVQPTGFFQSAVQNLKELERSVPWDQRVFQVPAADAWPFPDDYFDIVVSNQVGEHVADMGLFLGENARTLRRGGFSVHIFPLKNCVLEGHVVAPFAHRILSHDARVKYLLTLGRLGLDNRGHLRRPADQGRAAYAESLADYVDFYTSYRTWGEICALARGVGLRASHRYTSGLYERKALSGVGRRLPLRYRPTRSVIGSVLQFHVLKYVSSITVFLERLNTYTRD